MPVYLECIQSPTDADWQDLQKIHEETAADGLTKNMNELHNFLSRGGEILAGRFNDRIVGAILAAPCGSSLGSSVSKSRIRAYITDRLCNAVRKARCRPSSK